MFVLCVIVQEEGTVIAQVERRCDEEEENEDDKDVTFHGKHDAKWNRDESVIVSIPIRARISRQNVYKVAGRGNARTEAKYFPNSTLLYPF